MDVLDIKELGENKVAATATDVALNILLAKKVNSVGNVAALEKIKELFPGKTIVTEVASSVSLNNGEKELIGIMMVKEKNDQVAIATLTDLVNDVIKTNCALKNFVESMADVASLEAEVIAEVELMTRTVGV